MKSWNDAFIFSLTMAPTITEEEGGGETTTATIFSYPPLVVLVPETNIYRRVAKVHTTPDDSFMGIGCDYGITVEKIRRSLEEAGTVPEVWPQDEKVELIGHDNDDDDENGYGGAKQEAEGGNHRASCLGIDKSKESINIAIERYDTEQE